MSEGRHHYSLARARSSLLHFGIGRLLSALTGFLVLVQLVRLLEPRDYGTYIALIAFLEIFYLASGLGLSTVAQRYVAEYRIKFGTGDFAGFLWRLLRLRFLFSLAGAALCAAGGAFYGRVHGATLPMEAAALFLLLLVAGSCMRYFDEVFPALLLQAYTQGLALLSNTVKAATLALAGWSQWTLDYRHLVALELATALIALAAAYSLLLRYLARDEAAAPGKGGPAAPHMWQVARRFYLVQVLGQAYSPNAVKLLVTKLLGLQQTALLGFLQSLTDMLRNYSPAYLLAGWLRPLMVSRFVDRRDTREVGNLASLVFKLSLMLLVPFAAWFATSGDLLARWLSNGKYAEASGVLVLLTALVAAQGLHLLMSMVCATLERANANILATAGACLTLPLAMLLSSAYGLAGVVQAMLAGEVFWLAVVMGALRRAGYQIRIDLAGSLKILSTGIAA